MYWGKKTLKSKEAGDSNTTEEEREKKEYKARRMGKDLVGLPEQTSERGAVKRGVKVKGGMAGEGVSAGGSSIPRRKRGFTSGGIIQKG